MLDDDGVPQGTKWSEADFAALDQMATRALSPLTIFSMLTRSDQLFYEGKSAPRKKTHTKQTYDDLGNVITFYDAGEPGDDRDDVFAKIGYTSRQGDCAANHIVGLPDSIKVYAGKSASGPWLRKRKKIFDCATGNLKKQRAYVGNTYAETKMKYNNYGNLVKVVGPPNDVSAIDDIDRRLTLRFSSSY